MSYMLLVLQQPYINSTLTPEEGRHRYKIMKEYAEGLAGKGVLMGAEALGSERQSARLGKGTGGESVLDGPFIEEGDRRRLLHARCPDPGGSDRIRQGLPGGRLGNGGSARSRPLLGRIPLLIPWTMGDNGLKRGQGLI
jgi:hypothetical protein